MKRILKSNRGEGSLGTGVKIIIAVVVGALVLGGLFALWKTVLLPKMQTRSGSRSCGAGSATRITWATAWNSTRPDA